MKKPPLKILIPVIIGIIFIILGPVFGATLIYSTIFDQNEQTIVDNSTSNIRDAFAYPVTLKGQQKLVVEFSAENENTSARLVIIDKGTYDTFYAVNNTPPPNSGLYFVVSQRIIGYSPSGNYMTYANVGVGYSNYYYIEFLGDGNYYSLWYEPGQYYVVIYGSNTGSVNQTTQQIQVGITIKISGPGQELNTVFSIVGWLIMFLAGLLIFFEYRPRVKGGVQT